MGCPSGANGRSVSGVQSGGNGLDFETRNRSGSLCKSTIARRQVNFSRNASVYRQHAKSVRRRWRHMALHYVWEEGTRKQALARSRAGRMAGFPAGGSVVTSGVLASADRSLGDYAGAERVLKAAIGDQFVHQGYRSTLMVNLAIFWKKGVKTTPALL